MVLVDLSLGWFVALVQKAAGAAVSMPASRIMRQANFDSVCYLFSSICVMSHLIVCSSGWGYCF